jgi:hypothetical protein
MPAKPKARKRRARIRPRVYARQPRPANPSTDLRLQGVAAALGTLARDHRQRDLAAMVLDTLGLTIADLRHAGADAYDLAPLMEINSRLAQNWFDVAADELRRMGIALEQLPGAFRVNFIDGGESTAHILHTLEMAVAVGRIMAADFTHDRHR